MAAPPLSCAPRKVPSHTPCSVPHSSTCSREPRRTGSGARLRRRTFRAQGTALEVTEAGGPRRHPPWLSNFSSEWKERQLSSCAPRGGRVGNARFSIVLPAAPDQRSACLSEAKRRGYACLDSVMVSGARGCTGASLGSRAPIDSQSQSRRCHGSYKRPLQSRVCAPRSPNKFKQHPQDGQPSSPPAA